MTYRARAPRKLLIVDDSALMRKHLRSIFEAEGSYEIETARNGVDALEKAETFVPDVITLDVNMPEMDGITCLTHLLEQRQVPVVMVSSLTREGAETTMEALRLGAVDFVEKPSGTVSRDLGKIGQTLLDTVGAAGGARIRRRAVASRTGRPRTARRTNAAPRTAATRRTADVGGVVIIGASTGGPSTLEEVFLALPETFAWPIVVAQHMPEPFTGVFARRLDARCGPRVVEVDRPMPLEPATIYIGRGGGDIEIDRLFGRLVARPAPPDPDLPFHPSVDRLVRSAMAFVPAEALVGILLTGMGRDGAAEMARLTEAGGRTVAESEETAVVFGMPAALIETQRVSEVEPSHRVAERLLGWVARPARKRVQA